MSEPVQKTAPASPIIPGQLVKQGQAIQARLQVAFPPSLFHFKVLPTKIDARKWADLTQGNQPFIGLGFNSFRPTGSLIVGSIAGEASWSVLTAVRRGQSTDEGRYYGDAFGIGGLTIGEVAMVLLNGALCETGRVAITGFSNVAAEDWGHDTVMMKIDLLLPATLALKDEILAPSGLGWFDVLATNWNWKAEDGSQANYNSEWDNPNAQASD